VQINSIMRKTRLYFETTETVTKIKKGWVEVDLDYTQIYLTLSNVVAKLNSLASVKLLFWAFHQISKENMFSFNQSKIIEFNKWLENNNSKPYNERTMYNALKELIENGIVIKWSNGSYQLNPKFIWTDSIEKRIEHLKQLGKFDSYELIETDKNS